MSTLYGLIVTSRKAGQLSREGERYWVLKEPERWVPATSTQCTDPTQPPADLLTFETWVAARDFGEQWEGHPWWCRPKAYEVIEVTAVTRPAFDHYRVEGSICKARISVAHDQRRAPC